jgi:hypothetical protein
LVYDSITDRVTTASLSQARSYIAATSVGTKAIFAGGISSQIAGASVFDDVDVFDATNNGWTTTHLALARGSISAASADAKAVFAGGEVDYLSAVNAVDTFTDETPSAVMAGGVAGRSHGHAMVILSNTGDAAYAGNYTVQVYAIPPRQYHGAVLLGSQAISNPLAAGDSIRLSVPLSLPANMPAGTYHLVAMAKASDGTLTPFAGGTATFTVPAHASSSRAAPPAVRLASFSTTPITGDHRRFWLEGT